MATLRSSRVLLLVGAAALLASCKSAPPAIPASEQSSLERVGIRTVAEPKPSCEAGHDAALSEGVLTLRPGDTICVRLEVHENSVVPAEVVTTSTAENTLVVRAWIEPGTSETYLSLHNPLASFLRYEAHLVQVGSKQSEYTSSCPVLSGRIGIEQWPYAVSSFSLSGFKLLPESGQLACQ